MDEGYGVNSSLRLDVCDSVCVFHLSDKQQGTGVRLAGILTQKERVDIFFHRTPQALHPLLRHE